MKFKELKLNRNILKALAEAGYEQPTPIQEQSIPSVLEGRDLLGCAQTGTGKTCAFSVPIIQRLDEDAGRGIRALILTPTRENERPDAASVRSFSLRRVSLRFRSMRMYASTRVICP